MSFLPSTAFVLGAGLGTRLKALTQHLPKPLIPICNKPLIHNSFSHLSEAGVKRFIVNTHWLAHAYSRAFPEQCWNGLPIHFSHEIPLVLETAGGLKFAEHLLPSSEPFWVYNGDILSTLPLQEAWDAHQKAGNEVTLVLRSKDGPLQVSFDEKTGRVLDIGNRLDPHSSAGFLFTGIYLVQPSFLKRIPPATKLSVVPVFIEMIREGAKLGGVVIDSGHWWDLGTREQIIAVHQFMAQNEAPWIAPGAQVDPTATLVGSTAVGAKARIGPGAVLKDTIVWDGAIVPPHTELTRCIVTSGGFARGEYVDADL
jgi:NDP-sugar pyrophosphorylase family protein